MAMSSRSLKRPASCRSLMLHSEGNSQQHNRDREYRDQCEANLAPHKPRLALPALRHIDLKQTGVGAVVELHQSSA